MVVLVTGVTGFLGPYVVEWLISFRQTVRCLIHTPGTERTFKDSSIEIRYGDILDIDALVEASYGVDKVIHLADYHSYQLSKQTSEYTQDQNNLGTSNLLEIFQNQPSFNHFILVSNLRSSRDPKSGLSYKKWCNEEIVRNSGIPYTILRSSILFGESDSFINSIASAIRLSPIVPVWGSGHNRIQPLSAEDLATCIVLTLGRGDLKNQTLDIGGPQQLSYNEIIALVSDFMGKNRISLHFPTWAIKPMLLALDLFPMSYNKNIEKLNLMADRNVTDQHSVNRYFGFTPKPLNGNIDYVDISKRKNRLPFRDTRPRTQRHFIKFTG